VIESHGDGFRVVNAGDEAPWRETGDGQSTFRVVDAIDETLAASDALAGAREP